MVEKNQSLITFQPEMGNILLQTVILMRVTDVNHKQCQFVNAVSPLMASSSSLSMMGLRLQSVDRTYFKTTSLKLGGF